MSVAGRWHTRSMSAAPDRTVSRRPWVHGPLVGFDTETTGVDPCHDRLVTAAVVSRESMDAGGVRTQSVRMWLADPGVEIPAAAAAVHGVTTERARAEGRPAVEVLEEIASVLTEAMAANIPIVVFNAGFDLTLMEAELARHDLPTLRQRLGRELGPVLDPLVLDRAVDRYRPGKRRLEDLCTVYGVSVEDSLHTAEVDVTATLDVLAAITVAYPALSRRSTDELVPFQAGAHRAWAESFNDFLRRRGRTPDVSTSWPLAEGL